MLRFVTFPGLNTRAESSRMSQRSVNAFGSLRLDTSPRSVPTATTSAFTPSKRRRRRRRRAIRVYTVILLAAILLAVGFSTLLRHLG